MKISCKTLALGLAALAALIQLVPYGHSTANPPARLEPVWDSPQTRALVVRACFDCHSNETKWPWYSRVAPISWLVQRDVVKGRRHLNFSEFNRPQRHAGDCAGEVSKGAMPMAIYLPAHPEARLTPAEKTNLIAGLKATFGESPRR